MIRYQIRNEYGLSDPELFAAPGEEDDPEALLEGVAMAGLVGVLRQLGDLAEFAAEIFHDLHEDVMTTASRGHGLMLRLQQLEAEFPAVEKAIISQSDHSNYPHDEGVEWHANLQLKQNLITQGDMPRFILDSYEECRGPPHLFTLDKFDVAGAGASLKRYSDPSFFKTDHASKMKQLDVATEKKPRRTKKKVMRWRKGVTLESLLVTNSESHTITASKDRVSRKIPPRTTKLKSRHPRSPDHGIINRICREHLQELISSQQKLLSSYSARHYHVKFRLTDSTGTSSPLGVLDNSGALVQSSGKLELTKIVPLDECDTMETTTNGPAYETNDKPFLGKQRGPTESKEVCKMPLGEQNGMFLDSEKRQKCPEFLTGESNCRLQSARGEKLLLAASPADQNVDGCRPDDIASDHDNFVDALNNIDSECDTDPEIKIERDAISNVEGKELHYHSKEVEHVLDAKFLEAGLATDSSPGLKGSCNVGEPTYVDSPSISDSAPSTVSTTIGPNSGSPSGRQLNDVDWTNDNEPFNDGNLMDVSSSSSVVSDSAELQIVADPGCQEYIEKAYHDVNADYAAVIHTSDEKSPNTSSSGLDGLDISSNDFTDKAYHSVEHSQNVVPASASIVLSKTNDVSEDEEEISVGTANDLFLHPTKPNQEEVQDSEKELEEGKSQDKDHAMCINDMEMDNVAVPEEIVAGPTPVVLDPDDIHEHLDGIAPTHSNLHNNLLYESHDDEIVEDVHSLPADDLSTPFDKHAAEDSQIVVLGEGFCSANVNTHKKDSVQSSVMDRDFSYVHEPPGVVQGAPPSQNGTEMYVGETIVPSSCVFDDTELLKIGVSLAPRTSSLPDTTNACDEQHASAEMKDVVECSKVAAEESTTSRCADDVVPPEEVFTDASKHTETAEVATNSTKEDSWHDVKLQSSYLLREGMETVEATCRDLGAVDELREPISKKCMLQTDNIPPTEMETTGEKCSESDAIHFLSSAQFPEESNYQEELIDEGCLNAEVLSQCSSDKDGGVSLKSNMVEKQPADGDQDLGWGMFARDANSTMVEKQPPNVDQDLAWEMSAQDSNSNMVEKQPADVDQDLAWGMSSQGPCSTNPFMDPYMMSHAHIHPSSASNQLCLSEEQDVLSELLIGHDTTDSLWEPATPPDEAPVPSAFWEPATPPDEAPIPSEAMTEDDFRSFCHQYHQMDFVADTEGCHGESVSDSNNTSTAFVVCESDFTCSVSALPVKLGQEVCVRSKFGSQFDSSFATDTHADTSMPFSVKEDVEDETPGVDSHSKSRDSFSDNRSYELDMTSVPVGIQQEQQDLSGLDSHTSSCLLGKDKTSDECCSLSSKTVAVETKLETHDNLVPCTFINEKVEKLDIPPTNAVPVEPELGASASDEYVASSEFDSASPQPSSIYENKENIEAAALRTSLRAEQESEWGTSAEHDSQTACSSMLDDKIDEVDGLPLSNAVVVDQDPEVYVPLGVDSQIAACSSTDENIHGLDWPPLSSSVLLDLESDDHVSGDRDSQVTLCSLVQDKTGESEAARLKSVLPEEIEQDGHASPELDSQVSPCSLNGDKVDEIDKPPPCIVRVEPDRPTESDCQTAPCPSVSDVLADKPALSSTPVMASTDGCQLSPSEPPTVPFQDDSYEDPHTPPPLPPLQWRVGRPPLGLLSTKCCMPEPARRADPILQAASQEMDMRLGLLDRTERSIEPVSSESTKEDTYQNSMIDDSDQNVEFGRLSTTVVETDVTRTEQEWTLLEASENIKQLGHMSSPAIGAEEHLDDTWVTPLGVEKHLEESGVIHGTTLNPSNPLLSSSKCEQQSPRLCKSSDTSKNSEHPSDTHPTASEDDISVDGHNADGVMASTSATRFVSECHKQAQHGESFSQNSDREDCVSNTSEDKSVKYPSVTSEAHSDETNHSASPSDSLLKEGISQAQNVERSEDTQSGDPLPSAESMTTQDYLHVEDNLEGEKIHPPGNTGPFTVWSGDRSNFINCFDEGTNVHADQPPVMGWTVGPQMLHPNYGISVEDSRFEPNINHLGRKPISIRNIPRNPLVDAVAAHDRSSMRKVSELSPPTDEPKPNERNMLLEQIKNKTFNLKPVGSAMPTSMRSPARANIRNLKVAAIIEKANAIRQAVGSDDEDDDGDNWSDS